MDKVHDIANRYFHDRFAQVKIPGPSDSCLGRACTAEVGTNGAQYLKILKWPFGVSQMFEDNTIPRRSIYPEQNQRYARISCRIYPVVKLVLEEYKRRIHASSRFLGSRFNTESKSSSVYWYWRVTITSCTHRNIPRLCIRWIQENTDYGYH